MSSIIARILDFNRNRLPEMVEHKYQLMSQNAFRFFRGTCHLFYEDLAKNVNWKDPAKAWICGDLHLENYGSYKGDNGVVYFDMNDFDEAILAPPTWEVVRSVTSIHIAAKELGVDEKAADLLCRRYMDTYLKVLQEGKPVVVEKETAHGLLKYFIRQVQLRKQKNFTGAHVVQKGRHSLLKSIPGSTISLPKTTKKPLIAQIDQWLAGQEDSRQLLVKDITNRIAGTGSLGIERYVILAQDKKTKKLHLLDLKEALPSSLRPYVNTRQPKWDGEAQRVVALQKRVQHVSPALLNAVLIHKKTFVIKELQPMADRMDLGLCKGKIQKLTGILDTMAAITASGQLRSAGRQGSSIADVLISLGSNTQGWEKQVLAYAKSYAKKVRLDYQSYLKDYQKRIPAK